MSDKLTPDMICSYELTDDITIERCRQRDGGYLWAVRKGSRCLNKQLKFEYEPTPSNRDDSFFDRCRFDSADDAYDAYLAFMVLYK